MSSQNRSSLTGVSSGAPCAFQSGRSSVSAIAVHHRARQYVRADLGTLFEHDDAHVLAGFCRALLEAYRRGETGGAAADDHDVVFHCFALHADVLAVTAGTQLYNPRRRQEFAGCVSGDAPSRIVFASRRKKP